MHYSHSLAIITLFEQKSPSFRLDILNSIQDVQPMTSLTKYLQFQAKGLQSEKPYHSEKQDYNYQFYQMKRRELQPCDFMQCVNWDLDADSQTPNQNTPSPNQEPSNISQNEYKRRSFKNKYINKIKNIYGEGSTLSKHLSQAESEVNNNPNVNKKDKNKQAAKQSRDRKKMYIEIMEAETKQLEDEINKVNKQIDVCKIQIQKCTFNSNQYIGALTSKLSHVYKKLAKLIDEQESEDRNNQLNLAIDSISYRFGATGKERKYNINESYKQVFNLAYPSIHRYLLWAADQNHHLFCKEDSKSSEDEKWFKQMKDIIGNLKEKDIKLIESVQGGLKDKKGNLLDLINKLVFTKNLMEKQSCYLDNLFLEIREVLTPIQSAKFILFIEKYTYRNQIRYHQRIGMDEQPDVSYQSIKKIRKLNQTQPFQ